MQESIKQFYASLSDDIKEELRLYLERRFATRNASPKVGVVFDVLHNCILRCKGCGTNATFSRNMQRVSCTPTITQINKVFFKLKEYSYQTGKRIFVNIGGGEPFLRSDILDILQLAADYFGSENVGVDTNAALDNSEQLLTEAMQYVSYIGTSINGHRRCKASNKSTRKTPLYYILYRIRKEWYLFIKFSWSVCDYYSKWKWVHSCDAAS